MVRRFLAATLFFLLALALAACMRFPFVPTEEPGLDDPVNTAAAQTVAALGTRLAIGGDATLNVLVPPTVTPKPTRANTRTPTPVPVDPTSAPECNRADFEKDVTIPDGSTIL